MAARLTEDEISAAMPALVGWAREGDAISRTYAFHDFREAMQFVNRVAEEAETADHHPDIDIRYNRVTLTLSTHSAGGLTKKDTHLAERLDAALRPNL